MRRWHRRNGGEDTRIYDVSWADFKVITAKIKNCFPKPIEENLRLEAAHDRLKRAVEGRS